MRGPKERNSELGLLVSFLVPCYVIYSSRFVYLDQREGGLDTRHEVRFELSPEEQPYAQALVEEIEATFGSYEPMPPEIGNIVVPEVVTSLHVMGEATLFHCLFTDNW
jgi:hypothetical protein